MTIPEGYAQVTCTFSGLNAPTGAAVVFGVSNLAEDSATTMAAGIDAIMSIFVVTVCTSDITLETTLVKQGPDDTGASAVFSGEGGTGGQSATSDPPQVAYLYTKSTALGGRRGRGRMFMPGCDADSNNDAGVVSSGRLVTLQAAGADLLEDLTTAGWPMVLLHSPATEWVLVGGQPRRIPVAGSIPDPTEVLSLTASSQVASQRRRNRR